MTETSKNSLLSQILPLALGTLVVAGGIIGVYAVINRFSLAVVWGAILGAAAAFANQLFLIISVNRAFDQAVKDRGSEDMTEEQIAAFTAEKKRRMTNTVRLSMILRLPFLALIMLLAFLLPSVFDLLATGIAIIAMQLVITALGVISGRTGSSKK